MTPRPEHERATLVVSEVFGPTVSGEGRTLGERCGFVRLMGCNLHCTWCDTKYTWDADNYDLHKEGTRRWVMEIADELMAMHVDLVIISGGEPLLHQKQRGWQVLISTLLGAGIRVEVETNGTVMPTDFSLRSVHRFTVSPKLSHAGDPAADRLKPEILKVLQINGADFKFVCGAPEHVDEVARLVDTCKIPKYQVWIMPLGASSVDTYTSLIRIADTAISAGFNVTPRLHIDIWGNEKGH